MATSATTLSVSEINLALNGLKNISSELYSINELMEKYVNSESSLRNAIQKRLAIENTHNKKLREINEKKLTSEKKRKEILKEEGRYERAKANYQKKYSEELQKMLKY